jgi:fructose transport system substrate-binding protein
MPVISAGVKGILITPSNSTGVLGAVKKARDKGILVIALDTATDPADAVDATLATDNFEAGVLQGQYARKALGDKTPKLAMLDGTPGGTVDKQRHDGFLKGFGIKEGDPAIVGRQNTNGALDKGQTAMENLLTCPPRYQCCLHHQRTGRAGRLRGNQKGPQGQRHRFDFD